MLRTSVILLIPQLRNLSQFVLLQADFSTQLAKNIKRRLRLALLSFQFANFFMQCVFSGGQLRKSLLCGRKFGLQLIYLSIPVFRSFRGSDCTDLLLQKQQAFQLLRILLFQVLLTAQVAISDWNLSADALQSSLCLSNSTLTGKKFCDRALFLIIRDCLLCRSLLPSQIPDRALEAVDLRINFADFTSKEGNGHILCFLSAKLRISSVFSDLILRPLDLIRKHRNSLFNSIKLTAYGIVIALFCFKRFR